MFERIDSEKCRSNAGSVGEAPPPPPEAMTIFLRKLMEEKSPTSHMPNKI